MELIFRKDWDIVDSNCNVNEWECECYFAIEKLEGYSIEGDFTAFKTVRKQTGYEYPVVVSIGEFDVFKYDELVVNYPLHLIELAKQLIREEIR